MGASEGRHGRWKPHPGSDCNRDLSPRHRRRGALPSTLNQPDPADVPAGVAGALLYIGVRLFALDDSAWEREVVAQASVAMARAKGEPWAEPIQAALAATRAMRDAVQPFLGAYASEVPDDPLPSLWSR